MALLSGEARCRSTQATFTNAAQRCPFLRNIEKPTTFAFSPLQLSSPGFSRGPIFEDGPTFDAMFRIFHGQEGIVPLAEAGSDGGRCSYEPSEVSPAVSVKYHPLAASAATISLSAFGGAGPFSFDSFMAHNKAKKLKKNQPSDKKSPDSDRSANSGKTHEAKGSEWLSSGNCPIAKSYRAVAGALPLVAKLVQLPPGMKYRCPPAIVAARAALARTPAVKALKPQALPKKILAVGALGMAVNIPLGVWREHTQKFSPDWFLAVHASVPFIGMLRKAVVMPKYAMAFTIAAAILGQVIGSRAERIRVAAQKASLQSSVNTNSLGMASNRTEPSSTGFTITPEQESTLKQSTTGFAVKEQGFNICDGFFQDEQSQSSEQGVYQEAFGLERGVLAIGYDDELLKTGGGHLDAWVPDLSRTLSLNSSTSFAVKEQGFNICDGFFEDGQSQSSKQGVYQEAFGSERGVLAIGCDDKLLKTGGRLDAWVPDLSRTLSLNSSTGFAVKEQGFNICDGFFQDGPSQSSKRGVYQEAFGSERGVLAIGYDDKLLNFGGGGLDAWVPDLSRTLFLNPISCSQEAWAAGGGSSIILPVGSAVH